jgi:hypothetical protein
MDWRPVKVQALRTGCQDQYGLGTFHATGFENRVSRRGLHFI